MFQREPQQSTPIWIPQTTSEETPVTTNGETTPTPVSPTTTTSKSLNNTQQPKNYTKPIAVIPDEKERISYVDNVEVVNTEISSTSSFKQPLNHPNPSTLELGESFLTNFKDKPANNMGWKFV